MKDVAWETIFRQTSLKKFKAHKEMNANVGCLRLFPGITDATISAFLSQPIEGIVLETYGAFPAP